MHTIDRREFLESLGTAGAALLADQAACGFVEADDRKTEVKRYTAADVQAHLRPQNVEYVTLRAIFTGKKIMHCLDDRGKEPIIGTSAGLGGECVLMAATVDAMQHGTLRTQDLEDLFEGHTKSFGGIAYLHTDVHALEDMVKARESDPRLRHFLPTASREAAEKLLRGGPKHRREEAMLLSVLTDWRTMGCGHLRYMTKEPHAYGVRAAVPQAYTQWFYRRLWHGKGIDADFEIMTGDHGAGALLEVRSANTDLRDDTEIPAIVPCEGHQQHFVTHPQVADEERRRCAEAVGAISRGRIRLEQQKRFTELYTALGRQQFLASKERLAPKLPVHLVVAKDRQLRVNP